MQKRTENATQYSYARTERVSSELLRILAQSIEKSYEPEDPSDTVTVTSVGVDPDFRRAKVYFDHISTSLATWLAQNRAKLQGEVSRGVRIKRTPLLEFLEDPAIESGIKIDAILRSIEHLDNSI